jgi:hypothetical protein
MAITNNLLSQVDLPVWEWLRFNPFGNTTALTCLTTDPDLSGKFLYYQVGSTLYRYDTRADSWQLLSTGWSQGTVVTAVTARYVKNRGYRGRVLSTGGTGSIQIPSVGTNLVGYKIQILSGTGVGQIRTITAQANEVIHDTGFATTASANLLTDSLKKWKFNRWVGYGAKVIFGTGFGQYREVLYNDTTTLTVYDGNRDGKDLNMAQFNGNSPYGVPASTNATFSIISQVITVDTPWTIIPDKTSKFQILSDGIFMLSAFGSSPFFQLYYYDVLSDRWILKSMPSGLISAQLSTDFVLAATNNLVGDLISSTPTGVTAQTITDSTQTMATGDYVGNVLRITGGTGAGQERRIIANTATQFTLSSKWVNQPNTSSTYTITGEDALYLSGNLRAQMYKYFPEPNIWTQGNLIDWGVVQTLALVRPNYNPASHGLTSATRVLTGITAVASTPIAAGTGYVIGELITLAGGNLGRVVVENVSITGAVLTVSLYTAGNTYGSTGTKSQTSTSGVGTGCTINVTSIGTIGVLTTAINHDLDINDSVTFVGASEAAWNTTYSIIGIQSSSVVEVVTTATANAAVLYAQSTTQLIDASKNWIPNEHAGKMLVLQSNNFNGAITFRKIIGNSATTINFVSGVAGTNGTSRYAITDLETFGDDDSYLADNQISYGYSTSGATGSITDSTKSWVPSSYANLKIQISDIAGNCVENIVTSNTSTTLNIGRTIAVGAGSANTIVYSDDNGINWTGLGITTFSTQGNAVCWSGSRFIAGGQGTNSLAWSNDGITWVGLGVTFFGTACNGVLWNGFRFIAVGLGTNGVAYSNDGLTWTVIALGAGTFSTQGNAVAWNGTRVVAVGSGTNGIIYSNDGGTTWTVIALGAGTFSTSGNAICWSGSRFVAGGQGTNTVIYSSDGITWSIAATPPVFTACNGVAWNGTRFVAVGTVASGTNCIAYSTDGNIWTTPTTSIFTQGNGVSWNGVYFTATGVASTNTIAYSADGITWTAATTSSLFSTAGRGSASTSPFASMTPSIGMVYGTSNKYKIYDTTGTVTTGTTSTLIDNNKKWKTNQWTNKRVLITSGLGVLNEYTITSNTATQLTWSASTSPDSTSTYTIIGRPTVGAGIALQNNWNTTVTNDRGKLLIASRGSGSPAFDIYDIRTNRWKFGQFINGWAETLTTGTSYAYDEDRLYFQKDTTGRIFYYDFVKNLIVPIGMIPYAQSTAILSNRMEIIKTVDGLKYLYLQRLSGTEMWRTLLMF